MTTKPDLSVVEALHNIANEGAETFEGLSDAGIIAAKSIIAIKALPLAREQAEKAALYDSTREALEWIMARANNLMFQQWIAHYGLTPPAIIREMIEKGVK